MHSTTTVSGQSSGALTDLNGRLFDAEATKASSVDDKLQAILANPRLSAPIQVGMELAKVLFTEGTTTTTASGRSRGALTDLNGRLFDAKATKASSVDDKLQAILASPRLSAPIQVGMELAMVLFTEDELASSTLTRQRVNGQARQSLDPAKLCLMDNLVQQKSGLSEAEFSAIRIGIRNSLANRCKHLRLKLGPKNMSII